MNEYIMMQVLQYYTRSASLPHTGGIFNKTCELPIQVVESVGVTNNGLHSKLLSHLDDGTVPFLPIRLWVILKCQPGHFPLLQRDGEDI